MKIGNVELKSNVIMSPMAGITDTAYRLILEEQGAGLTSTEERVRRCMREARIGI